ncbi:MAG TPA: D-aminoacyl-tRNA deacylase [Candidatus Micrarchaeota archaeon]|nr:D-aminoacyl-tRNA deacylase [Candidatus Micrarchaeota archaeon]
MPKIIVSKPNLASINIAKCIEDEYPHLVEHFCHTSSQVTEFDAGIETDCLIVASTHKSASGKPALTVHVCGNWGKAELGGDPQTLNPSPPTRLKAALKEMSAQAKKRSIGVEITLEADHHGPTAKVPIMFVEVGSDENAWANIEFCSVAAAGINAAFNANAPSCTAFFGVGGGHYSKAFTKLELESEYGFAHIIPKYAIDALEYDTFAQAIKKSAEPVKIVLIEKDGVNARQRDKIIGFCKDYGIESKVF